MHKSVGLLMGLALVGALLGGAPANGAVAVAPASPIETLVFRDVFSSPSVSAGYWAPRLQQTIVPSRRCSVPWNNTSYAGGNLTAKTSKASGADRTLLINQAKAAQKAAKVKVVGCPAGAFKNSMVSTEAAGVTAKYGTLTARVKFPAGQGFHASIWLQSTAPGGGEIDMIESYGYGKGVASVLHTRSGSKMVQSPAKGNGAYVAKKSTKKKSWWGKFHTVSVSWHKQSSGATRFVYKIDGVTTRTLTKTVPESNYFVVVSNLTSDWELKYLTKPYKKGYKGVKKTSLPATLTVDWIQLAGSDS